MWDDEINKSIKEAADQYHPAYDDDAWNKMEQMLDEHLPQKKERRRIIYFILFTVIVCSGLFFLFYNSQKSSSYKPSKNTISKNNSEGDQIKKAEILQNEPGKKIPNSKNTDNKKPGIVASSINKYGSTKLPYTPIAGLANTNQKTETRNNSKTNAYPKMNESSNANIENGTIEILPINNQNKSNNDASTVTPTNDGNATVFNNIGIDTPAKRAIKPEGPKQPNSRNKQNKTNKHFTQNLGISLGIGPDISGVRLSRAGKLTFTYGAGLSYHLSNRFTLRTGFYIAKKIYSVHENEYHAQPGNVVNYNYLQSVNANCNVYEIPLTLSYNFSKVKNHNWFASAGLSSYLMKRESYVYFYKYPSGNTYNKSLTITNQNKHYFSVLDLSGGYEYLINNKLSVTAEPYVKLPLSGIGAGKIKLNSGGLLFTVTLKPFKK